MGKKLILDEQNRQKMIKYTAEYDNQFIQVMRQRKFYKTTIWAAPLIFVLVMCLFWINDGPSMPGIVTMLIFCPLLAGICYLLYQLTFTFRRLLSRSASLDHEWAEVEIDDRMVLYRFRERNVDKVTEVLILKNELTRSEYDLEKQYYTFIGKLHQRTVINGTQFGEERIIQKLTLYSVFQPELMQTLREYNYMLEDYHG